MRETRPRRRGYNKGVKTKDDRTRETRNRMRRFNKRDKTKDEGIQQG